MKLLTLFKPKIGYMGPIFLIYSTPLLDLLCNQFLTQLFIRAVMALIQIDLHFRWYLTVSDAKY